MKECPLLSLKVATSLFESEPHEDTVRIWMLSGVKLRRGENQRVVKLRYLREGSRLYTRLPWVDEFKAKLNGDAK